MPDGSKRRTFASDSNGLSDKHPYPECISSASETISEYFDQLDEVMSNIVTKVAGELYRNISCNLMNRIIGKVELGDVPYNGVRNSEF